MSTINNFLAAKTNKEKADAISNLEEKYGHYGLDFCQQISTSNEWNEDIQNTTIKRYLESRQEYLVQSENFFNTDFDELTEDIEDDKLFDYHLRIMSMVQNMGGDLSNVIEQAIFLALDDDTEVKGCGSALLLRASDFLLSYFPEILKIMAKHGVWERPFKIGKVFNYIIDHNPKSVNKAASKLDSSDNKNLIMSILLALANRESIPDVFDRPITGFVKYGKGEIRSMALSAISVKPKLALTLEDDIWSSLSSEEWFIRGNAAKVCGCARLTPSRFLPKLTEMLTDFDGHDWFPAESAVSAIAKYGLQAILTLPAIENAMIQWIEEYGEEDDEFIKQCQNTIACISLLKS